ARDEEVLVGHARDLRFGQFARVLAYWRWRADPDGAEDEAGRHLDGRRAHLSRSFEGCGFLDATFDPVSMAIFEGELRRREQELFDDDWAEARARVGDLACASDLRRTPAQRRLDALVAMARRSAAMPAGARMPEPLLNVFVGYETFAGPLCELATAPPSPPAASCPISTGPGSSGWSSTGAHGSSTWVCVGVCSAAPPGGRSWSETANASTSSATSPPRTARSTTSNPGPPAASPSRRTAGRRAPFTTVPDTDERSPRTAGRPG